MATVNMSIRTDPELKAQAEEILSQLGMTMNGTINMFLHQIVRDRAVPLSLALPRFLSTEETLQEDLRKAKADRLNGVQYLTVDEVLANMDSVISEAEAWDESNG